MWAVLISPNHFLIFINLVLKTHVSLQGIKTKSMWIPPDSCHHPHTLLGGSQQVILLSVIHEPPRSLTIVLLVTHCHGEPAFALRAALGWWPYLTSHAPSPHALPLHICSLWLAGLSGGIQCLTRLLFLSSSCSSFFNFPSAFISQFLYHVSVFFVISSVCVQG